MDYIQIPQLNHVFIDKLRQYNLFLSRPSS